MLAPTAMTNTLVVRPLMDQNYLVAPFLKPPALGHRH
jgi:hypothetical protein